MRKVFSSNEVSETVLIRDALLHHGVEATIQNEQSGRTAVPGFRPPAEIWVLRDDDYVKARQIVVATISTLDTKAEGDSWSCPKCGEDNPPTFEMCWSCGRDKNDNKVSS